MRRRPDLDDAVLVQLDEDDGEHGAPGDDPAGPGAYGQHRRRRRGVWWAGVAVLVVLAGAVGVVNLAEARRVAERRAAFADTPWVLDEMTGPLHEAWRIQSGWVVGSTTEAIFLAGQSGGLRAVDPATGAELWAVPEQDRYCWLSSMLTDPFGLQVAEVDPRAESAVVMCDQWSALAGAQTFAIGLFDPLTGQRLGTIPIEGEERVRSAVDGDLLVVSVTADDTITVTRTDVPTGEVVWTFRSEPGLDEELFSESWEFGVDEKVVLLDGPRDLVLSAATGEEIAGAVPATPPVGSVALADGARLEVHYGTFPEDVGGRVVGADGALRFEFPGWPWVSPYGFSGQSVLVVSPVPGYGAVTTEGSLVGRDIVSGDELWSRDDALGNSPLMALEGRAISGSPTETVAFDLGTGGTQWTHAADPAVWFTSPVTDGEVVLLADRESRELELVAVDLATGEDVWRMPAPAGLVSVQGTRGMVLMSTATEVIAYRP